MARCLNALHIRTHSTGNKNRLVPQIHTQHSVHTHQLSAVAMKFFALLLHTNINIDCGVSHISRFSFNIMRCDCGFLIILILLVLVFDILFATIMVTTIFFISHTHTLQYTVIVLLITESVPTEHFNEINRSISTCCNEFIAAEKEVPCSCLACSNHVI